MRRCFQLARLGAQKSAPNPMVGAVLVHQDRIIGEGYHHQDGGAHAEVEAVRSVAPENRELIAQSTLYVSLEPCCIIGRTPACTDLIQRENIPRVVVSVVDKTDGVSGQGIQILQNAGVEVVTGVLADEGRKVAAIRNTFAGQGRPYIVLKYAQSQDGFIGVSGRQVWLTNPVSKRLVHRWRSEMSAILVGTNTARIDAPQLTNRLYYGPSPLRIVLDRSLQLPKDAPYFSDEGLVLVLTEQEIASEQDHISYLQVDFEKEWMSSLFAYLHQAKRSSLFVEGGAQTLQAFADSGYWDEARIFTSPIRLGTGIRAPKWSFKESFSQRIGDDFLTIAYP